jgi:pimeloyl-ACP methyl ester carboxylesterase
MIKEFIKQGWTLSYKIFSPAVDLAMSHWIVLINGYSRPKEDFYSLARYLNESHSFGVLCLDNRGSGNSNITLDVEAGSFTLDDLAEDVFDICQSNAIKNAEILGISMGGMIALALARNRPDFVKSLHLVSTSPDPRSISTLTRVWKSDHAAVVEQLKLYVSEDFFSKNTFLMKALAKQIIEKNAKENPGQNEVVSMQRKAVDAFSMSDFELQSIHCRVYVYHGIQDRVIPPSCSAIFEKMPGFVKRVEYPSAGHLLLAEAGKVFFEDIATNLDLSC